MPWLGSLLPIKDVDLVRETIRQYKAEIEVLENYILPGLSPSSSIVLLVFFFVISFTDVTLYLLSLCEYSEHTGPAAISLKFKCFLSLSSPFCFFCQTPLSDEVPVPDQERDMLSFESEVLIRSWYVSPCLSCLQAALPRMSLACISFAPCRMISSLIFYYYSHQ